MDFMLTKEDCESREDLFDPKLMKYNSDFMLENWSPNSLDLMDSIFDTDILNFDEIDNLSKQNIIEPETYSTINQINTSFENVLSSCVTESPISSNSSDSGLSSDNLETDISPEYEPFSPAVSSPGPSISERGEKNSPSRNNESISSPYLEHLFTTATPVNLEEEKHDNDIKQIQIISQQKQPQQQQQQQQQLQQKQPAKVVVRKIPQIINLPTKRSLAQSFGNNAVREKEIKIVKISPQPFNVSNNKKMTTIQVKNPNTGTKIQSKSGTIVINNKANVSEVKKFIPVQTTTNPRSILLPVTVQDMKGIKAYKVFNVSTLKNYSNNNAKKIPTTAAVPVVKPVQENPDIMKIKPKIKEEMYSEYISDVDSLILEDIKQEDTTDGFIEECDDNDDESDNSVITVANTMTNTSDSSYPKLILSAEEKRLLAKEGITLPSHYPLTKYEERELKRIRRKIRNKISAQDSRKRKKEYVDGLEERVKQCTEENQTLLKKIKLLQTQNQNLMSQMKKLQALLSKGTNKTAHPTTCLLVILLSLALVATPNLKFGQNLKENELNEFAQDVAAAAADDVLQNRRSLLFDAKDHYNNDIFDEDLNVNDFIAANEIAINNGAGNNGLNDFLMNLNNCKMNNDSNNETVCKKLKNLIDFDVDDTNWYQQNKGTQKIQQQQQEKLQKTVYDLAAETYQKNRSQQTSGFNIKQNGYDNDNIFDKNIIEMMSKRSNPGLYEINIEKFGGSMDVTTIAAAASASAAATTGTNIKISE